MSARKLLSIYEGAASMHPGDLMKSDLLSKTLVVSSGVLLFMALILVLAAALTQTITVAN